MKEQFKFFFESSFQLFLGITLGQLLLIPIISLITGANILSDDMDLYNILLVSFAGTVPHFFVSIVYIYVFGEFPKYIRTIIVKLIHFLTTGASVIATFIFVGWFDNKNSIFLINLFLIIYVVLTIIFEIKNKKLADKINERINATRNMENETD